MNSLKIIAYLFFVVLGSWRELAGQNEDLAGQTVSLSGLEGVVSLANISPPEDSQLRQAFSFQSLDLPSLVAQGDRFLRVEGKLLDQLPDSTWSITLGNFSLGGPAALKKHVLELPLSGVEQQFELSFQSGKAAGLWRHQVLPLESSRAKSPWFESQLSLVDGAPQGKFQLKGAKQVMLGRFLPGGFAHDAWELDHLQDPDQREEWQFREGRLEKMILRRGPVTDTLVVYPRIQDQQTTVSLDGNYFRILALQGRFDSLRYRELGGSMYSLLQAQASYYSTAERIFQDLGGLGMKATWPVLKAKVNHYPLNREEEAQVLRMMEQFQKLEQISESLLGSTRLNILKHADPEVNFWLASVAEISQNWVQPLRQTRAITEAGLLSFVDRQRLAALLGLSESLDFDIPIPLDTDEGPVANIFQGPAISDTIRGQATNLSYLGTMSQYAYGSIIWLEERLVAKLTNQVQWEEIEVLEAQMLRETDKLDQVIDSL
ncbi:MAG: hypothetical protein AAF804_13715, partial [Bacteroidota bacterium]